jgi:GDP-D-mannose dehydratase
LNYENYVISKSNIDSNQRPLVSNPSKIKENLGWKTKTNVQELIKIMIKNKIH